ncbi:MAG: hypothetical protein OES20_15700 [Gammaproteobacteria bacterium]|nr:hypothetical protein [Gammaproteobacteria bacterium]MDH3858186.1 hypothetical protein [Gammaproteobacteria bacterium]
MTFPDIGDYQNYRYDSITSGSGGTNRRFLIGESFRYRSRTIGSFPGK